MGNGIEGGSGTMGVGSVGGGRLSVMFFFFFKQKTAYEIVSRDWSSDVCSRSRLGLVSLHAMLQVK